MEYPPEPAYLNLPGWRCIPVYAVPLSPTNAALQDLQKLMPSNIPIDPRQWSRQDVFSWLEWCIDHFALPTIEVDKFFMNGRGLCLLRKADFCERAPRSGDVLFNALQVLLSQDHMGPAHQQGVSASLLQQHSNTKGPPSRFVWPRSVSSDFHSVGHVIHEGEAPSDDADSTTAASPTHPADDPTHEDAVPPLSTSLSRQLQPYNSDTAVESCAEKINVRLLWDFLQQLLNDVHQRYTGCIVWKDKGRGVFKITDPHRLAALWGRQKNHLNMNFDKMSRALRYYYRVRILQKEPGERHCYRFLRHPSELRHCKQRSLLARDPSFQNGVVPECSEIEAALDMTIKEEGESPGDLE